ncbi:MAG: IS21 family transposase [Rhodanobacteraceae bacterium]|nr:IS21 family transposase [Rhodanobacteraceae bacterium]
MRQLMNLARLRFAEQRSYSEIAASLGMARSTVQSAVERFVQAGLAWPLPAELDEDSLYARLYPTAPLARSADPDFAKVATELKRKGVTRMLLWQEYVSAHGAQALAYSQFCARLQVYQSSCDPVMRMQHRPGEKAFVDYAGLCMAVTDARTGEQRKAQVFVSSLGFSSAIYAEATWTQNEADWIAANDHALIAFGGVPGAIVPDNLKAAVTRTDRYEPAINTSYQEWAEHVGTTILPARVRSPDDKAKVENAVRLVTQSVLAPLRDRVFFSLAELNVAIHEGVAKLNAKPFAKREGSRDLSLVEERAHLRPLPASTFQYGHWRKARVNIDYHIEVDKRLYSVPHALIRQQVDVRVGATLIEVYRKGQLVAAHPVGYKPGDCSTKPEHLPEKHRGYLDRTQSSLQRRAAAIGEATAQVIAAQATRKTHAEQTYRTSLGILRLAKDHGAEALEAACRRALELHAISYRAINDLIRHPMPTPTPPPVVIEHANVRGAAYYGDRHAH